ncbi:CBS and ACT domain-containing protein [Syntrophomonas erecta]
MKVKERMTTNVITVTLATSLTEAFRLMKENSIRRLPVMDKGNLVGIVTLSDLNQASPSSATSLSIHELNYILAKTIIKDILPKKQSVVTIGPDNYIETAAKVMRKNTVSGLPVMNNNELVGMITETDIFDAFIDILGVNNPHSRLDVIFPSDRPGALGQLTGLIGKIGINILNAVVYYDKKKDKYKAILRIETLKCDPVLEELRKNGYEIESVIVAPNVDK